MTLAPPQLPDILTPLVDPDLDHGDELFDSALSGDVRGPEDLRGVELVGCSLTDVRLSGRVLDRLRLVDVTFERCDLSGLVLSGASWTRVELRDCRLTGAVLSGLRAQDVRLVGCRADQLLARMSSWTRARFDDCDLRGADFYDATLVEAELLQCDLRAAILEHAQLAGTRLHGSRLDGVVAGEALRGVHISPDQVLPLAMSLLDAFGITVEE